jgi:hypothetical protein
VYIKSSNLKYLKITKSSLTSFLMWALVTWSDEEDSPKSVESFHRTETDAQDAMKKYIEFASGYAGYYPSAIYEVFKPPSDFGNCVEVYATYNEHYDTVSLYLSRESLQNALNCTSPCNFQVLTDNMRENVLPTLQKSNLC